MMGTGQVIVDERTPRPFDVHEHEHAVRHEPGPAPAGGAITLHMALGLVSLLVLVGVAVGRELSGAWAWIGYATPVLLGAVWIGGFALLSRISLRARDEGRPAPSWVWLVPVLALAVSVLAIALVHANSTPW